MSGHLIVVCGLPGAGKTTVARQLADDLGAVRLCPDDWLVEMGVDLWDDGARAALERRLLDVGARLLALDATVVNEFGLWTRRERDEVRDRARALGATVELRYLEVAVDELWRRISTRRWEARPIERAELDAWATAFEAPTTDERALYDGPPDRAGRRL